MDKLRFTWLCCLVWLVDVSFGQVDIEINSGVNDATGRKMEGENGLKFDGEKKDMSMTITGLELKEGELTIEMGEYVRIHSAIFKYDGWRSPSAKVSDDTLRFDFAGIRIAGRKAVSVELSKQRIIRLINEGAFAWCDEHRDCNKYWVLEKKD